MPEIVTVMGNPHHRRRKGKMRHRRRHRRNHKLRVRLKGKLRTYKSIRKMLKKKAKSFWRKSRKYHGRKAIGCPPCRRRKKRSSHRKGRKHSSRRKGRKTHRKGSWRAFMKKFMKRHKGKGGLKKAGRAWRKKTRGRRRK